MDSADQAKAEPQIGARIRVQDLEGEDLGYGTYQGEVSIVEASNDQMSFARIRVEEDEGSPLRLQRQQIWRWDKPSRRCSGLRLGR
jgi:hypothetical protein